MPIHIKTESAVTIIQPEGHIDAALIQEFSACMTREIREKGARKMLVDLSLTDYMSSASLGAILDAHKLILSEGGELALCSPNKQVTELLEIVQMRKLFSIYKTEFEALDALID